MLAGKPLTWQWLIGKITLLFLRKVRKYLRKYRPKTYDEASSVLEQGQCVGESAAASALINLSNYHLFKAITFELHDATDLL